MGRIWSNGSGLALNATDLNAMEADIAVGLDGGNASGGKGSKIRRDTAANWTSANPTLAQGELGIETDTGYLKIGDGSTAWTSLAYGFARFGAPAGVMGLTSPASGLVAANWNAAKILRPWYAALGNRASKRANVVCIGDSITEGHGASTMAQRWVSQLAAGLRAKFPVSGATGGRGYISAVPTFSSLSYTYPATSNGSTSFASSDYAPKRDATSMGTTGAITFSLNGTSADIMTISGNGFGTLTWKVDGGSTTTINENNSGATTDGILTRVSLGSAGAHTLVVSGATFGSGNFLDGVIEYNGDENAGITVHDAGHSGWKSGDWSGGQHDTMANWPNAIKSLSPDVIILSLGVNDIGNNVTPSTFQSNMATLMGQIRAESALASTPVIVTAIEGQPGVSSPPAPWSSYVTAMANVAIADGNSIAADLTLRMAAYNDSPNYGMWYDANHPSNLGHQMIADQMLAFLSPS